VNLPVAIQVSEREVVVRMRSSLGPRCLAMDVQVFVVEERLAADLV
jgi:hypothetical protein